MNECKPLIEGVELDEERSDHCIRALGEEKRACFGGSGTTTALVGGAGPQVRWCRLTL